MKKLFNGFAWSAICALGLFSCTEKDFVDDNVIDPVDPNAPISVNYEAITPTNFIDVPVREGFITVVTQGAKTLLVTREATTLEVMNPQYTSFTRANQGTVGVDFSYLPDDGSWNDATTNVGATMYKTIMFEDLVENTDKDYNDLIIHVQQYKEGNKLRLYIHPIALGSYDQIALGADIFIINSNKLGDKCASIIFSDNVRKDLFAINNATHQYYTPDETFVNTTQENTFSGNGALQEFPVYFVPPVEGKFESLAANAKWEKGSQWIEVDESAIRGKAFGINWFIINMTKDSSKNLYAVPAVPENMNWRDQLGYPYGIISAYTRSENWPLSDSDYAGHDWINYPMEKVHINDVYTGFHLWAHGVGDAEWDSPTQDKSINAIGYIKGNLTGLPTGSKALFDIEGCMRNTGYSTPATNVWGNGNPVHENIPLAVGRTWVAEP